MTGDERRQQLSDFLARRGFADLSVLVAELGVSESTIRRDLSQLEEEGIIRRTHGGAVFVSERFGALNYSARESAEVEQKTAIGKAAAELVGEGETILIDGGTTTFQVARHLATRSLQVVTNSLPIANLLSSAPSIELIFVGGYIYPRTGVALGPIARQALASLHFSKVFMGAAGITADGLYNANVLLVEAQEQMMRSADQVIVVADHTKFGRRSLAKMCGWDRIDRVVSDEGLDTKWQEVVRSSGADMILAPLEESPMLAGRAARGG
ncbi:MAG TPA: DeoR/GlpR family DNA-binding transcription regulator [Phycisphaerae bacterium]|nr:DeoR/GlpR family DNA-binding transcription regulator [Phycisphaerae bacterium]HPU25014.1 DeoR/GlpR family DNA-binding transcription regulator [Phycisphaerae bacterium]HPZ99528.1 DeoR/GlpR family DNA-binding transcription regulator [Phycisphaerae bacterium]HQE30157.1 DeoR/GlpR family DNA-binding transcription regulator [Phycisphaerae bacterium]